MTEEKDRYLQLTGATIHYGLTSRGENRPAVLLIHGLASNATRWIEFVLQTALKETFDLIRIDLRGHGYSQWRNSANHHLWCEDIRALLDHEGYDKAVLIGHSLGAQTAMHYANRHSDQILSVITIDPILPQALLYPRWLLRIAPLTLTLLIGLVRTANTIGLKRRHVPVNDLYRLDQKTRAWLKDHPDKSIADIYLTPSRDLRYIPSINYLQDVREILKPVPVKLPGIPRLALFSQHSSLTDIDQTRSLLGEAGFTIETLHADHWPLTEAPEEIRRIIEDWCLKLV